jgi:hypothetical protein
MMKDGLKGKEIFVKIHLQNKNRNSAVVTWSASGWHIPHGNQDSTYITWPESLQTRPEKLVFNYLLALPVIFNFPGVLRAGWGIYYNNKSNSYYLVLTLVFMRDDLERLWKEPFMAWHLALQTDEHNTKTSAA